MKTQVIGDIRIDRVVDMEGPFAPLDYMVPGAPPELMFQPRAAALRSPSVMPRMMTVRV